MKVPAVSPWKPVIASAAVAAHLKSISFVWVCIFSNMAKKSDRIRAVVKTERMSLYG